MIKPEQTSAFKKALNKAFCKFRVQPRYHVQNKLRGMGIKDLTALNDYLSTSSDQDLKELSNNKLISDVVEDFKINLIKNLVLEAGIQKRHREQEAKNIKAAKERLKKQQEAQKLLQVQMQPNFFTQLKLTTEQKAILKKMVDG